jgi:hypothetical protein
VTVEPLSPREEQFVDKVRERMEGYDVDVELTVRMREGRSQAVLRFRVAGYERDADRLAVRSQAEIDTTADAVAYDLRRQLGNV